MGLQDIIMRDIAAKVLKQAADKLEQKHPDQTVAIEWLRTEAKGLERR